MASQIISVSRETLEEIKEVIELFLEDNKEFNPYGSSVSDEKLESLKKKIDSLLWIDEKKV